MRVVFVESNGGIDASTEDWDSAQQAQVQEQIALALDWWAATVPEAHVSFEMVTEVAASRYEPVNHTLSTEKLWISDALADLGFGGSNHFEQAYTADDELRRTWGADWATTIFVVDSDNDPDGRFADGLFAYSYIGGPFLVVTSDASVYSTRQLAQVVAHELGHTFGALDQYDSAGTPCTATSGYLDIATSNSQARNCGTHLTSIMWEPLSAYQQHAIDPSALGQIGYRDSDGDSLPDPIDTEPALEVSFTQQNGERPRLLARVADKPFPSPQQHSLTINTIERVEYRVDGDAWHVLPSADGAYDSAAETVDTLLPLYDGTHIVELRAINSGGAASPILTKTLTLAGAGASPDYEIELPDVLNQPLVTLTVRAPAGYEARIGGTFDFAKSAWASARQPFLYEFPPTDGEHILYIVLRDEHGLETPITTRTVLIDQEAPTGYARLSAGTHPALVINAEDTLSGVEAMQVQLTPAIAQNWQPFSTEVTLPTQAVPTQIRLRDRAGNISAPLTIRREGVVYLPLMQH